MRRSGCIGDNGTATNLHPPHHHTAAGTKDMESRECLKNIMVAHTSCDNHKLPAKVPTLFLRMY